MLALNFGGRLMSLATINPLIGATKWTKPTFHLAREPIGHATLLLSSATADWTVQANSRQGSVRLV